MVWTLLLACALAAGAALAVSWGLWRRVFAACQERDRARTAEVAGLRDLRLCATDLRAAGMSLLGQVEQVLCEATGPPERLAGLGGVARQLLSLADDLQDRTTPAGKTCALVPEPIDLEAELRDAIAAVDAMLGPGRRRWRLSPELAGIVLRADRRALAHVLARTLGNAARHSGADDWIEVAAQARADALEVTIEDEGSGLGANVRAPPGQTETRGLGLGLAMARRLMQAQGGSLTVEAVARVGTRVTLGFPAACVVSLASVAPVARVDIACGTAR